MEDILCCAFESEICNVHHRLNHWDPEPEAPRRQVSEEDGVMF